MNKNNSSFGTKKSPSEKGVSVGAKRKKILKNLLIISVFILFVSLAWVVLEGYHQLLSREMAEEADYLVSPLNSHIDTEVISQAKSKKLFSLDQVDNHYQSRLQENFANQQATEAGQLENQPIQN
jgi:ATP-dependent protease Clp ATPase subunit